MSEMSETFPDLPLEENYVFELALTLASALQTQDVTLFSSTVQGHHILNRSCGMTELGVAAQWATKMIEWGAQQIF